MHLINGEKSELLETNEGGVFIYGAGNYGQMCANYLIYRERRIIGYVLSDEEYTEMQVKGLPVYPLSKIMVMNENSCMNIIVVASNTYRNEMTSNLVEVGADKLYTIIIMEQSDYIKMYRTLNQIDQSAFLLHSSPCDYSNGSNRGTTISRYYVKQFLDYASGRLGTKKDLLDICEVGDNRYSNIYYPNENHFILSYRDGMDLTDCKTLPNRQMDVFICTQVYNFIFDVRAAIVGSNYLLKDGGVLLCTVAGNVTPVIQSDMDDFGDYWRFTYLGIRRLFEETFDVDKIDMICYGNAMACTAYIQGMCVEDLPRQELLDETDPRYALVIGIIARK